MKGFSSVLGSSHARQDGDDCPWILGDETSAYGKLVRYLSGGGMRTFGRTLRQEQVRRRQNRFLTVVAALGVVWLVFMFA